MSEKIHACVCPHCMQVAIFDTPNKLGDESRICPCLHYPPITSGIGYVRLRLPEGFEVVRKAEAAA